MEFPVLGRPDVYHDGERLDTGPPKQRAVHFAAAEGSRHRIHDLVLLYARERALEANPAGTRNAGVSRLAVACLGSRATGS
jgi:hypothetical protein